MKDNVYFAKKLMIEMKKYAFKPDKVKHAVLVDVLEDSFEYDEDFADNMIAAVEELNEEWRAVLLAYLGYCPVCLKCELAKSLTFEAIAQVMAYDSWEEARAIYKAALEEVALDFIYYYFAGFVFREDESIGGKFDE